MGSDDEIAYIDAPDDATGNVTVFVNGTQCFKKDISNIDRDVIGFYTILLSDLDYEFLPGSYIVKIVYDGNRMYSPFSEEDVIRIVGGFLEESEFFNINDNVYLGDDDEIAYFGAPDDATGNVTVFVNGVRCFKKDMSNIDKDEYGFYTISLKDVDYEFSPGEYFVKMVYSGDEHWSQIIQNKTINVLEGDFIPVEVEITIFGCGKNETYWFYAELGDDNEFASISAPDNAIGNITVLVNGVQCFRDDISNIDKDEYGDYTISLNDLDYDFSPETYFVEIIYQIIDI